MSTDPNTLIAGALCINSCIPQGMQLPVLISIAVQIANSGGTGGGGSGAKQVFGPSDGPVVGGLPSVVPTTQSAFYIDSDGTVYTFFAGVWH